MSSIVNPWQFESVNIDDESDYILNMTFNDECLDNAKNYNCLHTNYIGKYNTNKISDYKSIEFNGSNNYIEFNLNNSLQLTSKLAWGGWFLPIQKNNKQYLFYSKNGITMFINENNKLYIKLYTFIDNMYKYAVFISKECIKMYEWNYILCLYDYVDTNHIITVYINNCALNGTVTAGLKYPNISGLQKIIIGNKKNCYYYKGLINNFFIKSNYCIKQLFEKLNLNLTLPLSHWNICNLSDTKTLFDIYGINNGTIINDVYKLNFGKDCQHVQFNSQSLSTLHDRAFTITLSIYLNNYQCKNMEYTIFSSLILQKCGGFSLTFVKNDKQNYIKYSLRILNRNYTIQSPFPIKMTTWNNILITYNGLNCMEMYHNNVKVGTNANIYYGVHSEVIVPTYLGGSEKESFPGIINNIKVFNRQLSSFEIKKVFIENYLE
jgi:hypothetical protein